jgi:2,4-didehydro-3-deoxy-L-rhamnonate hydrolase
VKLLRYGPPGQEKPGILDREGAIRDLSGVIDDISPQSIKGGLMARLQGIDPARLPRVEAGVRIGPCLSTTGNFLAIGLNYADHAEETNAPIPAEPILFNKAPSCIAGPYDDVILPKGSRKSDWEVELAFVIGKRAQDVPEAQAMDHVLGYTICNDISEREFQLERNGGQWMKGKCCPTFGPIGPWLVTRDEVPDPQQLSLWLEVNGTKLQNGSTRTMIFPIAMLVSYMSRFVILEPGDIVTTGTPPGVGLGMKPERFLKAGDVMRLGVEGLGVQEQKVR